MPKSVLHGKLCLWVLSRLAYKICSVKLYIDLLSYEKCLDDNETSLYLIVAVLQFTDYMWGLKTSNGPLYFHIRIWANTDTDISQKKKTLYIDWSMAWFYQTVN